MSISAVYAGTFDPPTNGHWEIVKKTHRFCDVLHIVIAQSSKQTTFTPAERKEMWQNIIWAETQINNFAFLFSNVKVHILPENVLLANFAKTLGASLLIRGMRDTIDFVYEQKIEVTNKRINNRLESVFLMPSQETQNISSSWVKDLSQYKKSYDLLIDSVNPVVLSELDRIHLKNKLGEPLATLLHNSAWNNESKFRYYHNYSHIRKMLEDFSEIENYLNLSKKIDLEFPNFLKIAIMKHDAHSFDQKPSDLFKDSFPKRDFYLNNDKVMELIMATDYSQPLPQNLISPKNVAIIRYLDLKILAANPKQYEKYSDLIEKEYYLAYKCNSQNNKYTFQMWKEEIFAPKRIQFLKELVGKNVFYKTQDKYFDQYILYEDVDGQVELKDNEDAVQINVKKELKKWNQYLQEAEERDHYDCECCQD